MSFLKKSISILSVLIAFSGTQAFATDEPFVASITVYSPIVITETAPMTFGAVMSTAAPQVITVAPTDAGAAAFDIAGQNGLAVTAAIVETAVTLTGGASTITVNNFTYGGSIAGGTAAFNNQGAIAGAKVGASANVPANPSAGAYTGTLTFRVVYQ